MGKERRGLEEEVGEKRRGGETSDEYGVKLVTAGVGGGRGRNERVEAVLKEESV